MGDGGHLLFNIRSEILIFPPSSSFHRERLPVGFRDHNNVAHSDWPSGVFPWECVNMVSSTYFAFRAPLITQARIEKIF